MSTSPSSETRTLPINDVRPYWRNPRKISSEAVDGVKRSLEEFGYLQPIVVDRENVIIIGHTRYSAMRRLGVEQVAVKIVDLSQAKARELRVIDNKTHEYGRWDYDLLDSELVALKDDPLVKDLFIEEVQWLGDPADNETATQEFFEGEVTDEDKAYPVEFVCPSCFHEWEAQVRRTQVLTGRIEEVNGTA